MSNQNRRKYRITEDVTIEDISEEIGKVCGTCGGTGKFHKLQCPRCLGSGVEP